MSVAILAQLVSWARLLLTQSGRMAEEHGEERCEELFLEQPVQQMQRPNAVEDAAKHAKQSHEEHAVQRHCEETSEEHCQERFLEQPGEEHWRQQQTHHTGQTCR